MPDRDAALRQRVGYWLKCFMYGQPLMGVDWTRRENQRFLEAADAVMGMLAAPPPQPMRPCDIEPPSLTDQQIHEQWSRDVPGDDPNYHHGPWCRTQPPQPERRPALEKIADALREKAAEEDAMRSRAGCERALRAMGPSGYVPKASKQDAPPTDAAVEALTQQTVDDIMARGWWEAPCDSCGRSSWPDPDAIHEIVGFALAAALARREAK